MSILLTGAVGYIGSHIAVELLDKGEDIVIVDDSSNSNPTVLEKIKEITNKNFIFYEINLCDKEKLEEVFRENKIDYVMHFAGYKAVGESIEIPLTNNFVFSSSDTVYGNPHKYPIKEDFHLSTTNPYGSTKLIIENILKDLYKSNKNLNIAILIYFNPVDAHRRGLIGEDPNSIPNNIMSYISQFAVGKLEKLTVFENDYNKYDGTGVRGYIHVVDLANGHIKALDKLRTNCGLVIYNLGTGNGYSVLNMTNTFSEISGRNIYYEISDRIVGYVDICYADSQKANNELNWKSEFGIKEICVDLWDLQVKNIYGYK